MATFSDPSYSASNYAKFRPTYPPELYNTILDFMGRSKRKEGGSIAVDVGTGTGQVATELSELFDKVIAVDPSEVQIRAAIKKDNIEYQVGKAEDLSFIKSGSVDLVTVGQGIHWFDAEKFMAEVKRILKPNGVLAFWGYEKFRCAVPEATELIKNVRSLSPSHGPVLLDREVLAPYWEPGVKHIHDRYAQIAVPFARIKRVTVLSTTTRQLWSIFAYLNTWSAVKRFRDMHPDNPDPIAPVCAEFCRVLGKTDEDSLEITQDMFMVLASDS